METLITAYCILIVVFAIFMAGYYVGTWWAEKNFKNKPCAEEKVCEHIWNKEEPLFGKSDFKCTKCGEILQTWVEQILS